MLHSLFRGEKIEAKWNNLPLVMLVDQPLKFEKKNGITGFGFHLLRKMKVRKLAVIFIETSSSAVLYRQIWHHQQEDRRLLFYTHKCSLGSVAHLNDNARKCKLRNKGSQPWAGKTCWMIVEEHYHLKSCWQSYLETSAWGNLMKEINC